MQQRSSSRNPSRVAAVVLLCGMVLLAVGWWQRQYVYDSVKLWGYHAPTGIAALADAATMTDPARRVFYVNQPQQKDRSSFAAFCPSGTEQTVVLGCYKGGQRGIFLLTVDNQELTGIQQVTAAHEMLHAQYDRLSKSERAHIDGLLQQYYDNELTDKAIKETIDGYRTSEPDALVDEMHSIIGTEVPDLPMELEQYYARYFTDRAAVVRYYQSYAAAFSSRQQRIKDYDAQLSDRKKNIDALQTSTSQGQRQLESQRSQLEARRSAGDTAGYNQGVGDYNQAVSAYNAAVRRLQTAVNEYNALVAERNTIAFEEQQLVQSLSVPSEL